MQKSNFLDSIKFSKSVTNVYTHRRHICKISIYNIIAKKNGHYKFNLI